MHRERVTLSIVPGDIIANAKTHKFAFFSHAWKRVGVVNRPDMPLI